MNKKTSTVAILVAVIFSIILFPLIAVGGLTSGLIFSAEELLKPDREEELYQSFVENGGVDWVYDLVLTGFEEGAGEDVAELGVKADEFITREWTEDVVYDVYHAFIKGEKYQFDFSYQKDMMRNILMEYFDENIISSLREEYGEAYDLLSETEKAEAVAEAKRVYTEEVEIIIEEELGTLEKETTEEFNAIYDTEEFRELKALEEETGFSMTDRTELCATIRFAGYIMLGITCFLIVILLLCHLFRPSGFFTAGAFTLVIGGGMTVLAKTVQGILLSLVSSEFSAEYSAEEFPGFIMPMIDEALGWSMVGLEKVGKYGLMAAVILILVGILLFIIQKNKKEAEPVTGMQ